MTHCIPLRTRHAKNGGTAVECSAVAFRVAVGFIVVVCTFSSGAFGKTGFSNEVKSSALGVVADRFFLRSTEKWVTTIVPGPGTSVRGRETRGESTRELKVSGKRAWLTHRQKTEGVERSWNTWWLEGLQLSTSEDSGFSSPIIAAREGDEDYLPFRAEDGGLRSTATPSAWLDGEVAGAEDILKSLRTTAKLADQGPEPQRTPLDGGRLEQVILETATDRKIVIIDRDHGGVISSLELELGPASLFLGLPLREAFRIADMKQASQLEANGDSASTVVKMNVQVSCDSFTRFHGVWLATSGRRVEIMMHEDGTEQRIETFVERRIADLAEADGVFRRDVNVKDGTPVHFPYLENVIPLMWSKGRIVSAVDNQMVQATREEALVGTGNRGTTQPAANGHPNAPLGEDPDAWERKPIIAPGLLEIGITSTQPTASELRHGGQIMGRGTVALIIAGVMSLLLIAFWAMRVRSSRG